MTPPSTLVPVRPVFRAIVRAVVPAAASLDEDAWSRAEAIVDEALADRTASIRRQIVLFMRVVNALSYLRFLRSLAHQLTSAHDQGSTCNLPEDTFLRLSSPR